MARPNNAQGFTIIEVLVTIALLSVIVLVVLTPLTGFFGLTRRSGQQVDATQSVQRALEQIRGAWLSVGNYDQVCVPAALPATDPPLEVAVTSVDLSGDDLGAAEWQGVCNPAAPAPADVAPLRRVSVTRKDASGRVLAQLDVLVDRP